MQTRFLSLVESFVNQIIGFLTSMVLWELVIKPLWGLETSLVDNFTITAIFTVVSIVRSYALRRLFNKTTHQLTSTD